MYRSPHASSGDALAGHARFADVLPAGELAQAVRTGLAVRRLRAAGQPVPSQEAGELTPTLKLRRQAVYRAYADILDALYTQVPAPRQRRDGHPE